MKNLLIFITILILLLGVLPLCILNYVFHIEQTESFYVFGFLYSLIVIIGSSYWYHIKIDKED